MLIPEDLPQSIEAALPVASHTAFQLYTPELADRILEPYIQGRSLMAISKDPEMPAYSTLLRWCRHHPQFREEFKKAREARALHYEERALAIAENAQDLDAKEVPGAQLAFNILKWGAEVGDNSQYGKKTTVEGNPDKPLTFIIQTGFPELTPAQMSPKLGSNGLIVVATSDKTDGTNTAQPDYTPIIEETLFDRLTRENEGKEDGPKNSHVPTPEEDPPQAPKVG